ncbi:hypothetical protein MVEN_02201800 [Mycena venus]|uniref:Uncharacterized protein n=1 Tax=Mycena venus TaxID=2733690 RepID=A0A8H6X6U5_9AGAR|nr:hypothetical protein MVEN_02201800 [Mycena venus]
MLTPPVPGMRHSDSIGDLEGIEDWTMVGSPTSPTSPTSPGSPTGRTEPGQGATEADPFLMRLPSPHSANSHAGNGSGNGSGGGTNSTSTSSRGTNSTSASSGTNVSGYGVLLAHPSLSLPPPSPHAEGSANPFDVPAAYAGLPRGAAPPGSPLPMPGRRILSPSQMAILVEEEDGVLPRMSEDRVTDREEGEVVVATRVSLRSRASAGPSAATPFADAAHDPMPLPLPPRPPKEKGKETRRSWIPRLSWLLNRDSASNSRRTSRDIEEEGGLLLFDAGRGAHSPSNSVSSPVSPPAFIRLESPPRRVGSAGAAPPPVGETMREFGARPLLPFLTGRGSRPASGVATGSRPISGVSGRSGGVSSDGTNGTNGSGKSGGTVYTDALETLNSRAASFSSRAGTPGQGQGQGQVPPLPGQDPLDAPAPPAFVAFAGSALRQSASQASLPQQQPGQHSREDSLTQSLAHSTSAASHPSATLAGSASNTTLALATPATGHTPLKPERAYAHGPPGLGAFDSLSADFAPPVLGKAGTGSVGSWDKAGLELGFSRPASHSQLGTFGSANANGPVSSGAPFGGMGMGGAGPFGRTGAPFDERSSSAPHLSLDLEDAPPGAEGRWRLLGGSAHSLLLGSSSSLGASQEWSEGAGRRGTFGLSPAAQYHRSPGQSSEHGSFHSRLGNSSLNSSSLSSVSSHGARLPSASAAAAFAVPVLRLGPLGAAFGHLARDGEHSGSGSSGSHGRRQENSSGSGSGGGDHARSPLRHERGPGSPVSPLLSPWAGGLDPDWRPM